MTPRLRRRTVKSPSLPTALLGLAGVLAAQSWLRSDGTTRRSGRPAAERGPERRPDGPPPRRVRPPAPAPELWTEPVLTPEPAVEPPEPLPAARRRLRRLTGHAAFLPALLALVSAGLAQTWFRAGRVIAYGDIFPLALFRPADALGEARSIWGHGITPTGAPDYYDTLETLPAALGRALELAGAGPGLAQRIFLTLIFAAFAPAMYGFVRALLPRAPRSAAVVGAAFYAFNPALYFVLPNAVLSTSYALLPLVAALIVQGVRTSAVRYPILVALAAVPVSYAFFNPPALALVLVAAFATLAGSAAFISLRRAVRFTALTVPLVVLASLWWIVPVALYALRARTGSLSSEVDPFGWRWTHERGDLLNVVRLTAHWSWPRTEYFPFAPVFETPGFVALGLVPAAVAVAAAIVARGRLRVVGLSSVALGALLVLLAKGLHEPFSGVNAALYRSVPGMWLFREPSAKFTPVLAAVLAVGLAVFVSAFRTVRWRAVAIAALAPVIAALSFPIWAGQLIPGERPNHPPAHVAIPDDWWEAATFVNGASGATLLLPLDDYYQVRYDWGYYGSDHLAAELFATPVFTLMPAEATYLAPDEAAHAVQLRLRRAVEGGRGDEAARLMRALGIRWAIVRGDVAWGPRDGVSPTTDVVARLVAAPELRHARTFGALDVYEVADAERPPLWAASTVASGDERDVASALGAPLPPRTAVVADAPDELAPVHVAALEPGDWAGEARSDAELTVREGTEYQVWASWPAGVTGVVSAWNGGLELATPAIEVEGMRSEQTVVPLDGGVAADRWIVGGEGGSVPVGPDGPSALVWQAAGAPPVDLVSAGTDGSPSLVDGSFESDLWGPVGDCNARDARTPDEVGIDARRVSGGTTGRHALELTATEHAACVQRSLASFSAGASYLMTLDYRLVRGAPPRVCLWQVGPDRCADSPPLAGDDGWLHYERVLRVAPGTTDARVYLYADGVRGGTVVQFDSVDIREYTPAGRATTDLRADSDWHLVGSLTAERDVAVGRVVGLPDDRGLLQDSFELRPWGPVGDCNAQDGRGMDDVGIAARRVSGGSDGLSALELTARAHAACVSWPVSGFDQSSLYRVSVDYRRLAGATPRICVWQVGVDRCVDTPALDRTPGWHRLVHTFTPEPGTRWLELYLYADGEAGGTAIHYDRVSLARPVPRPRLTLVETRETAEPPVADVKLRRVGRTRYEATVVDARAPFLLVLDQTFDDGWRLTGADGARHVRANGYANGWVIQRTGTFTVVAEYAPQRTADLAALASAAGLPAALLLIGFVIVVRRRLRNRTPKPPRGVLRSAGPVVVAAVLSAGVASSAWVLGTPDHAAARADASPGASCPSLVRAADAATAGRPDQARREIESAAATAEGTLDRAGSLFGAPERLAVELQYEASVGRDDARVSALLRGAGSVCA